jgi:hypothetical protein
MKMRTKTATYSLRLPLSLKAAVEKLADARLLPHQPNATSPNPSIVQASGSGTEGVSPMKKALIVI